MADINNRFIALEGGEGSGKTTVINMLREKFKTLPDDVVFTREPGGTKVANKIRAILMDSELNAELSVLTEILLFLAARANIVDKLIRPALQNGKIVITDRFDGSTVAYQIYGREMRAIEKVIRTVNDFAKGKSSSNAFIEPGLVILLDISPVEGLARIKSRSGGKTRFDNEEFNFHKRVRDGFLAQANESKKWHIVDASPSPGVVFNEVWSLIMSFLNK